MASAGGNAQSSGATAQDTLRLLQQILRTQPRSVTSPLRHHYYVILLNTA